MRSARRPVSGTADVNSVPLFSHFVAVATTGTAPSPFSFAHPTPDRAGSTGVAPWRTASDPRQVPPLPHFAPGYRDSPLSPVPVLAHTESSSPSGVHRDQVGAWAAWTRSCRRRAAFAPLGNSVAGELLAMCRAEVGTERDCRAGFSRRHRCMPAALPMPAPDRNPVRPTASNDARSRCGAGGKGEVGSGRYSTATVAPGVPPCVLPRVQPRDQPRDPSPTPARTRCRLSGAVGAQSVRSRCACRCRSAGTVRATRCASVRHVATQVAVAGRFGAVALRCWRRSPPSLCGARLRWRPGGSRFGTGATYEDGPRRFTAAFRAGCAGSWCPPRTGRQRRTRGGLAKSYSHRARRRHNVMAVPRFGVRRPSARMRGRREPGRRWERTARRSCRRRGTAP